MSGFWIGNLFLVLSLLITSGSQLLLKRLMDQVSAFELSWAFLLSTFGGRRFFLWAVAGVLVVTAFLCWLVCLKYLKLSYAFTMSAGVVVLMTFLSVVVLREEVTLRMWIGAICVTVGMALIVQPEKPQQDSEKTSEVSVTAPVSPG